MSILVLTKPPGRGNKGVFNATLRYFCYDDFPGFIGHRYYRTPNPEAAKRLRRFLIRKSSLTLLLAALALVCIIAVGRDRATAVSQRIQPDLPPGSFVARVFYDDISDLDRLSEFDLWEYNNLEEGYVLVALTGADFLELETDGWHLDVDREATAQIKDSSLQPFKEGYRTVDELYADLESLNGQYPELTELVVYGEGSCLDQGGCTTLGGETLPGYQLRALRISNEEVPGTSTIEGQNIVQGQKPVFFLLANIHAREITTAEIGMRLIDWLLKNYGQEADPTWLIDWHEIWVVPTANPDGHWLVELGTKPPYNVAPFFQRKNANNDADDNQLVDCSYWPPTASWQYGVDLNRNHSFAWGPPGSSAEPCSQTFRGPESASEPETAALQALVSELIPDQRGPAANDPAPDDTMGMLITLHSYSELILRPWGHTSQAAPNEAGLKAIGDKMATYNNYLSCQPGSCLYESNGTTDDWAYGELGIPAYTFEIGSQFMPPYAAIDDIQWPENRPAFLYGARIARSPYRTVLGPDTTDVQAEIIPSKNAIEIIATVDDGDHGGQTVAGAAYTIDDPFWTADALPYPMVAKDGAFDSITETVTVNVELDPLSAGKHMIFVHGQDSSGNWGITSAVFVNVDELATAPVFVPFVVSTHTSLIFADN